MAMFPTSRGFVPPEILSDKDSVSLAIFYSISLVRTLRRGVDLRSGWPNGRLGHVPVDGALIDVGRNPFIGIQ